MPTQITKRVVDALPPNSTVWDTVVRGFGVRKQRRDAIYVIKYRANGERRYETIGLHGAPWTVETARKEALKRIGLALSAQSTAPAGPAFIEVMEHYLRSRTLRPSSLREVNRFLRRYWAPLHDRSLNEITRRDVALLLNGPSTRGARMALSAFFNWAIREGYEIASNPVAGTNRPTAGERERVLTNDELRAVWRACADDDYGCVVRLLILTGQRREEVAQMTVDEIANGVWTILATRTKNKRTHVVPLTPLALSLLRGRVPIKGTGRLFNVGSWSRAKAALDARVKIPPFVLHDIRRSVATGMADLGILPHVIEMVLNHVSGSRAGVAGIYNRSRLEPEVRDALERWAAHVSALVS